MQIKLKNTDEFNKDRQTYSATMIQAKDGYLQCYNLRHANANLHKKLSRLISKQ